MEQKSFNYIILVALLASIGITFGMQAYTINTINQVGGGTTLKISGSTTCYPVIATASQSFMAENPSWNIQVGAGGSGGGVTDLENGVVDIAMTSRGLKQDEGADNWNDHRFALDGVAVIINKGSTNVTWLTMDELFLIYNGTITNWDQLDNLGDHTKEPTSGEIQVYGRESGSGTRGTFEEMVIYNVTGEALEDDTVSLVNSISTADGNPAMRDSIGLTPNAIGYCGMAFYEEAQHVLIGLNATDGSGGWEQAYKGTAENVQNENYPISRYLHMWTPGPASGKESVFISYVLGQTGQFIVQEQGYVKMPS